MVCYDYKLMQVSPHRPHHVTSYTRHEFIYLLTKIKLSLYTKTRVAPLIRNKGMIMMKYARVHELIELYISQSC